jgi:histidinol-phosphate aminotransferase
MRTRDLLARQLEAMGFLVCPSATNFLFVRHPDHDAASLASALRACAILVRHFRQPEIENYLRISIGTEAECSSLQVALVTILNTA